MTKSTEQKMRDAAEECLLAHADPEGPCYGETLAYIRCETALAILGEAQAQITTLEADVKRGRDYFMDVEEREAACCPEDVGFDEYIGQLKKQLAEARERDYLCLNHVVGALHEGVDCIACWEKDRAGAQDTTKHTGQASAWRRVWDHCKSLGMDAEGGPTGLADVLQFITRLAEAQKKPYLLGDSSCPECGMDTRFHAEDCKYHGTAYEQGYQAGRAEAQESRQQLEQELHQVMLGQNQAR